MLLAANAVTEVLENPLEFRNAITILSTLAVIVLAVWLIAINVSRRKAGAEREPANLAKYLPDEDLEDRRLERVLAVALFWSAIIAVGLVVYGVFEPDRQTRTAEMLDERSIERGEALYANAQSEHYNSALSLACATCHGQTGEGGAASFVIPVDQIPEEQWEALEVAAADRRPISVSWQAPALNTALLKYPVHKDNCSPVETLANPLCRSQVYDIITYGRPGTPMPAWGVQGGGAKNTQAVTDLVNYIGVLQEEYLAELAKEGKTPADVAADLIEPLDVERLVTASSSEFQSATADVDPSNLFLVALQNARTAVTDLSAAEACLQTVETSGARRDDATEACKKLIENDPTVLEDLRSGAASWVAAQRYLVATTQARLDELALLGAAYDDGDQVAEGALLFQANCARCHTRNWSVYAASGTNPYAPAPLPQGSGAFGPSLVDGATLSQFVTPDSQVDFVTIGSVYQQAYGVRGIGTGKMPGFGAVLTPEQIEAIVAYERSLGPVG